MWTGEYPEERLNVRVSGWGQTWGYLTAACMGSPCHPWGWRKGMRGGYGGGGAVGVSGSLGRSSQAPGLPLACGGRTAAGWWLATGSSGSGVAP